MPGAVPEQLEDPRRCRGRKGGWQSRYARYMSRKATGKYLGVPFDWRRPTVARVRSRWWNPNDRRIVTPKSWGWGFAFNFAEITRRLHVRG